MRLRFREGGEARMVGREMAGGIGRRRVARHGHRLATATAKVDLAPVAGAARLLHPVRAAKCVEGGAIAPDIAKIALAHIVEDETGQCLRGVAGQRLARRRHGDDRSAEPPVQVLGRAA